MHEEVKTHQPIRDPDGLYQHAKERMCYFGALYVVLWCVEMSATAGAQEMCQKDQRTCSALYRMQWASIMHSVSAKHNSRQNKAHKVPLDTPPFVQCCVLGDVVGIVKVARFVLSRKEGGGARMVIE